MIHPLVGLLGITVPLLVGFAQGGSFVCFDPHMDTSGVATRLSAGAPKDRSNASAKLSPVLVKLAPVETGPQHTRMAPALDLASRTAFSAIPGVTVLGDDEDPAALAKKSRKPVIVLAAKLQDLVTSKQGDEVEFRAQIQYVIYRMPNRDIAAVLDGAARTRIAAVRVRNQESRQQVEDDVASAAVESAAKRAPAALLAITRR